MIRRNLLRKEVLDKHLSAWGRAPYFIGGQEATTTSITSTWKHPATVDCISKAFGLSFKILGQRGEVGYVNIQLGPDGVEGVYKLKETPSGPISNSTIEPSAYDKIPIDSWNCDSTQIVCVMLCDTSTMVGGETAIRTGDGRILKARGAKMGGAVVMQGCHTPHAALRATNVSERISMVTSYSFVDPNLDDSGTSLRSISSNHHDLAETQDHFLLHKLAKMRERIDIAMEQVKKRRATGELAKREDVEPWVEDQITFLKRTC